MGLRMNFKSDINLLVKSFDRHAQDRVLESAQKWHAAVVRILSGPRTGKIYNVPGSKRTYTASAPGEPPAVRTGDLRRTYRYTVEGLNGIVGSPLPYAPKMEFGDSKVAPRPHLKKSFDLNRREILEPLTRRWY